VFVASFPFGTAPKAVYRAPHANSLLRHHFTTPNTLLYSAAAMSATLFCRPRRGPGRCVHEGVTGRAQRRGKVESNRLDEDVDLVELPERPWSSTPAWLIMLLIMCKRGLPIHLLVSPRRDVGCIPAVQHHFHQFLC